MLLNFTKTYENRTDIYKQIENLVSFDLKTGTIFGHTESFSIRSIQGRYSIFMVLEHASDQGILCLAPKKYTFSGFHRKTTLYMPDFI